MLFVVLCPGTPEGSTGSDSGFKASQKTGQRLKVSSDLEKIHFKTYKLFNQKMKRSVKCVQKIK